jgi:hypothetical protein
MEGEGEGGGRAKLIRSREEYGWRESKREGEDQRESDRRERKGGRRREIVASLVLSSSLSLTLPHHNTHTPTHTHTHTHISDYIMSCHHLTDGDTTKSFSLECAVPLTTTYGTRHLYGTSAMGSEATRGREGASE